MPCGWAEAAARLPSNGSKLEHAAWCANACQAAPSGQPTRVQGLVQQGALLPLFHTSYWLGLAATPTSGGWPYFDWLAADLAAPASVHRPAGGYSRWAEGQPDNGRAGLSGAKAAAAPAELCAAATAAGASGGVWGWRDVPCSDERMWICKLASERAPP